MGRRKRRTRGSSKGVTRRRLLFGLGGGGLIGLGSTSLSTDAFSLVSASRSTAVSVASDTPLIGLNVYSPVPSNTTSPVLDVTNNLSEGATVIVSLNTTTDGTLHHPEDQNSDSVEFPLSRGETSTVSLEPSVQNTTVAFSITVRWSDGTVEATRETYVEAGNVKGAVTIQQVKNFSANRNPDNNWTIQKVKIKEGDNDNDLDYVEYDVTDSTGATVASDSESIAGGYNKKNITLWPDDGSYQLQQGETYTLTVTAYDADGNSDTVTRTATA